jgi:predicted amidohydrolase YtcJ
VYLKRVDGHAAWLNRTALEAAGIRRDTRDPPGGRILRDDFGEPTGVLIDNATDLVSDIIPDASPEEIEARIRAAVEHCTRRGLVGVHDAGTSAEVLAVLEDLAARGELDMHVYSMLSTEDEAFLDRRLSRGPTASGDGRLVVRAVKLYADGALGSRGAALLRPYDDDPENTGLLVETPETLSAIAARATEAGFQVCIHAIGDRGNRVALDVCEQVRGGGGETDRRPRIEHCQVVADADFSRFAALGVIPSMQPTHATSDMYWAEDRVGPDRIRGAYAWRRFIEQGSTLALGSDFPVEAVDPLWGVYAAATRQDHDGRPDGGWYPEQRLTIMEAVRGFTVGAAHAEFAEGDRGRLVEGMRADVVVLDRNIMELPPAEILAAAVLYTIVDGDVVYESPAAP